MPNDGLTPLPIDPHVPALVQALREHGGLVLTAPPGAGKSTRLPPALLAMTTPERPEVLVLQPRRLAARMLAARVAEERGEPLGVTVGSRVRLERIGGDHTRLWFCTEGVLLRRLLKDPQLERAAVVVLDEFHERSLDADLALALLRRIQRGARPDLRLAVLSATLDPGPVARFLGDAVIKDVPGRAHPVSVHHAAAQDRRRLAARVASALGRALEVGLHGDALVFLPGLAEIRAAAEACAPLAARADLDVLPLHGRLPREAQDRAVRPSPRRKLILSTNVAETSLTIEGVRLVIDSGLARRARISPWSGLPRTQVVPCSRASAEQRAGRAGRTAPGRALRLYTDSDHRSRPARDTPEVLGADLCDAWLLIVALTGGEALEWLEAPPPESIEGARAQLIRLGALDGGGQLTPQGRQALGLSAPLRLARVMIATAAEGAGEGGALVATILSEADALRRDAWHVLDPLAVLDDRLPARARRVAEQLTAQLRGLRVPSAVRGSGDARPVLRRALLRGFPDRLGRVVPAEARGATRAAQVEIRLASGQRVRLPEDTPLGEGELVLLLDAEERDGPRGRTVMARALTTIDLDELLDVHIERVEERRSVAWNPRTERVESRHELIYEGLTLEASSDPAPDEQAVAACLFEATRGKGLAAACRRGDEVNGLRARLAFLRRERPDLGLPDLNESLLDDVLHDLCQGRRALRELQQLDALTALMARIPLDVVSRLDRLAPAVVQIRGGRKLRVAYPPDRPPEVASRMQDFFGMRAGPTLLEGQLPLVLHLLAPNRRAVQVTTDLAGFWERHYPHIARELQRRYPRHAWPEDPLTASPPPADRTR
jgi:ATP-dependent helicase HrpB